MKKDIADKWVADLRAKPPQTRNVLFDGGGYCCLGRLCLVMGATFKAHDDSGRDYYVVGTNAELNLPLEIINAAGMNNPNGAPVAGLKVVVGGMEYNDLAQANDGGRTFAEIADAIEAQWEKL